MADESFNDARLTAADGQLSTLLARTDALLQQGAELSALLRAAADDVANGRPVPQTVERLARWSSDTSAHLTAAESLAEVARWDLDLAEELAVHWAGDPDEPAMLLSGDSHGRREAQNVLPG